MEVKQRGSDHYKTGGVEPIDLYEAGEMLQDFCLSSIIKYAFRNRSKLATTSTPKFRQNLEKIKHYCDILLDRISE